MIPISKIVISREEEKAVLEVLRSGNLAQGEKVEEFEKSFAKYISTKYAVAVSSGTAALHLSLLAMGIGENDKVITTPFSFIASTNAILFVNAKPIFVDIKEDFNIDASKIEEKITSRTKAILLVHLFGNPCDMDVILKIAKKYNLKIIEDACQAHGAEYKGKKIGSFGIGCFSFYATKNITTGEGGIITTNNKKLYEKIKMLRSHGSSKRYYHKFLGFNFRLTEMQAALGIEQLKKLDKLNEARIANADYLTNKLRGIRGLIMPKVDKDKKHVFHQYTLRLTEQFPIGRDELGRVLEKNGIGYGIFYPLPIHKQEELIKMRIKEHLPKSEELSYNVISVPIHPSLSTKDLDYIAEIIKTIK